MSCDIVSDLTISAIVCAMAGTEYGAAGLHDEDDGTFYSAATCSQKVGQMLLDANFASVNDHKGDGIKTLYGCLADATTETAKNKSTEDHTVTHTIVQRGTPLAKKTDKLVLGNRVFYVVAVDDTGGLGISTLYYVEERDDIKNDTRTGS